MIAKQLRLQNTLLPYTLPPSEVPLYHNSPTHLLPQLGKFALELFDFGIDKVLELMGDVDFLDAVDALSLVDNVSEIGDPSTVPCENLVSRQLRC